MQRLLVRVFTHPACSGCSRAVHETWEATGGRPGVELRTVSLADKEGLAEAHAEGISTIPSVILGTEDRELHRWVGTPETGAVRTALDACSGAEVRA